MKITEELLQKWFGTDVSNGHTCDCEPCLIRNQILENQEELEQLKEELEKHNLDQHSCATFDIQYQNEIKKLEQENKQLLETIHKLCEQEDIDKEEIKQLKDNYQNLIYECDMLTWENEKYKKVTDEIQKTIDKYHNKLSIGSEHCSIGKELNQILSKLGDKK